MKYVFFDASSGLSGDMILGALLDLGVDHDLFKEKMAGLRLPVEIKIHRVRRGAFGALKVDVRIRADRASRADVGRRGEDHRPEPVRGSGQGPGRRDLPEAFRGRGQGPRPETPGSSPPRGRCRRRPRRHCRLRRSWPRSSGRRILRLPSQRRFRAGSKPRTASCPCPRRPWPSSSRACRSIPPGSQSELVTPTGAAIASRPLSRISLNFPSSSTTGSGTARGAEISAKCRTSCACSYGDARHFEAGQRVFVIEATIDDAIPQLLAHFLESAFELGALDATLSPVVMKKNRLGTKLTLLAPMDRMDALIEAVFRETTSIGVRYFPVERRVLERAFDNGAGRRASRSGSRSARSGANESTPSPSTRTA